MKAAMSVSKPKLFAAFLALTLNIVCAPISWARMTAPLGAPAHVLMAGMEHCSGQMKADSPDVDDATPDSKSHPACCKGGGCFCGCLPSALTVVVPTARIANSSARQLPVKAEGLSAAPLEDPLRPPIY